MKAKSVSREPISDDALTTQARHGHRASFTILMNRHRLAATAFAREVMQSRVPSELVETAYDILWHSIVSTSRHSWIFRRQLFQTIRTLAISQNDASTSARQPHRTSPTAQRLQETTSAVRAFRRLPLPWQEALWYLDVERISATDAATYLGLARSTTRALRTIALDQLKQEWIEIYCTTPLPLSCDKAVQIMRTEIFASRRSTARSSAFTHINGCLRCTIVHTQIDNLMAVIRPALRRPLFIPLRHD
ncbi:RNA polymerase sigma factor [Sanguibacter inulinus]|uniref:Sigma-70 family RNA polymerase sigma factor n=1 Tax=Sanguibacter inulinus TaxID=60922 RepID=A0A853ET36_9MICO|nr:hypothetical protein [Sanguibacter inulinus]MBF0720933.1 hypothetical protein [Sanguibacter inulinus]NYS92078.1 hypothetical protein [Sanguibacter inulinus]